MVLLLWKILKKRSWILNGFYKILHLIKSGIKLRTSNYNFPKIKLSYTAIHNKLNHSRKVLKSSLLFLNKEIVKKY
jgi:hypothetical protein